MKNESLQPPGGQMVAHGEPELGVTVVWLLFQQEKNIMLRQDAEKEKCQRERERGMEKERENNKKRHGGAIEVPNLSNC